ncbi:MAG: antibiotic biosynthesis monooxygenase [Sandaracinus sp.]|nr:antibiotic biosynthesis monooxygenase [Sandaracinus sp.]MCB9617621.1 antibiotic biosynthesis monooxygenase [Sandaracinus sp.]MCB9622894.1 antibiotic biosynthesis monooxygenase [Sandaracinus sp.]
MTQALEIARFTLHPEHAEDFLASTDAMLDTIRRHFDGLLHFQRAKLEDGSYVDLVLWRSLDDAQRAAAGVMEIPEFAKCFASIDRVVEMIHGDLTASRDFR